MGLTGSKPDEGVYYNDATPIKYEVPKRRLNLDPRSPSDDITRTPIVVNKTPETLLDPRSPTPGIVRTPITTVVNPVQLMTQHYDVQQSNSMMEITDQGSCYPDTCDVNENCTLIDVPANKADDSELIAVLDNNGLDILSEVNRRETENRYPTGKDLFEASDCSAPLTTELQNLSEVSREEVGVMSELQNLSLSDDEATTLLCASKSGSDKVSASKKTKGSSKIPRPCQPKKLFTEKKKCDVTRSPLSTVIIDTNSPRNIMQRKQVKKIDKARQCRLDGSRPQDKENFSH
ncbi:uncharacterized protein LOC121390317 [Gigantopelta aegis]|uniref:uncharacterized protein LOC121390317 n=1 Tax=Gigantopelta aegis TaxID=1735272 RepID=UPI001B88A842|nr:uncharacterized protein LOC121390317 [Gigantopelta aegis]XP_041378035.1 uncharacterized protein LOC121390317 [Gigantopelta aegis]XP_041378036.1 uncharacterized protein LOC121390317 [Gigantopelta aegis]XP_041378037.1 uncharacterized protein LOC121390317 [Gigantopelta aegis]